VATDSELLEASSSNKTVASANAKPRRWYTRLGRALLWTLLILLLIALIALGVVYYLAGTDSGFARVSQLANERVPGLSIDNPSGNLQNGITAKNVSFTNDTIRINATELSSSWRLRCLIQRSFCLDDLHVKQLDITALSTAQTTPAEPREGPIELPDIKLPIDVTLSDISIERLQFQGPGQAPPQIVQDIRLTASTEGSQVDIDNLSLAYDAYDLSLTGTATLEEQYPLELTLNVSSADILPDSVPEGEGQQPLQLQLNLSDSVENLSIDANVTGLTNLSIAGTAQPLQQNLPLDLKITSDTLGWPVQTRNQLLASDTRIDLSGDLSDYAMTLQTRVSGDQIPDTAIDISTLINTDRIDANRINIGTLGGQINGLATVELAQPLAWRTQLQLSDIDPSHQVQDLQGELDGTIEASGLVGDGRWSLKLDEGIIEGQLRELPFLLNAKLTKGLNELWFIERMTLNNDANQITVQGLVGDELDLNADINLTQLQNLVPELAGGFGARLAISGPLQGPDIFLQADADVLRFNDVLIRSLSVSADVTELFEQDSSLDVTIESVRQGDSTLSNTSMSLNGTRAEHSLELITNGPQQTSIDLALNGSLDNFLNWNGLINRVDAQVPSHQVTLAEPAQVAWQDSSKQLTVSPHCWSVSDNSSLCLEDEFSSGSNGQSTLSLDNYPLQQLNSFLPSNTNVTGRLSANAKLGWGDSSPNDRSAVLNATIDQARLRTVDALGEPVSFDFETIALDANLAPENAAANMTLSSATLGTAEIDLEFDPSQSNPEIDGALNLQGLNLGVALPFLPVLRSELLPIPITGGNLIARIQGQGLSINGQLLSDEGNIDVNGGGRLDPGNWNASLNLQGKNLNVQSDPLQASSVNPSIRIEANARRVSVTGNVDIPYAVIDVEELPQGAATVSSDVVIIEDEEELASETQSAPTNLNLQMAVGVSLGDDVTLSAYGLNANLTGDMEVRVRPETPLQLGGEILVVDGIYKQYGQDLQANGQILFVGQVEATRLAIDAVREIEDEERTAGLRIQGTVNSPELTLFTEPADKSNDAILSYIVLGRDINETSDQDADLLATAALALAIRGGRSVGNSIANRLGVEEFGLESRGSGDDSELLVTGRLNDRLLLRYGYGVFDSDSTLYVRYDLTKKLYLETANSVLENALDLFYSFSF